jgi:hypothetical protein
MAASWMVSLVNYPHDEENGNDIHIQGIKLVDPQELWRKDISVQNGYNRH